jgi:hypothetical protein
MVSNAVVEFLDIEYAKDGRNDKARLCVRKAHLEKDKWRDRDIMRISRS